MKGLIFNIQRYSLHDGGGIRTIIFFKGCPIHCPWCSNPESQSFKIETAKINNKCIQCSHCSYDIDECPSGAITNFGQYITIDELITEILKDSVFYRTSGGGVTLSGGEVLSQAKFATKLLKKLKDLNINTAVETCGVGKKEDLISLAQYVDTFLFDLKIMNEKKSKKILGADINIIKSNFKTLIELGKKVIPRVPLIPEYTLDDKNINEIIKFIQEFNIKEIHLLPFHQYGSNKYEFLNKEYQLKETSVPSETTVNKIKEYIENKNINVIIGGL